MSGLRGREPDRCSVVLLLLAGTDAAVLVEVDHTLCIQLLDDFLGLHVLHLQSVIIGQPLLDLSQASNLRLEVLFLQQRLLLVSLDLGMSPSALAADLQHVGTGTFLERDGSTLHESGTDLGVHLDHQVTLLSDSRVPLVDLLLDPAGEGLSQDRVGHVDDPLLRQFVDL